MDPKLLNQLRDLSRNEPIVNNCMYMFSIGQCSLEEALATAVIHMTESKNHYYERVLQAEQNSIRQIHANF